jgi:predicted enzyme related to lactoylglutathione lyase
MAKLRHIAITVKDLEETAKFYENVFGLERHFGNDVAVSMSDGVINLTLLKFPTDAMAGDERGKDFVGIHHMGFVVDDLDATGEKITRNGGRFHMAPTPEMAAETKYRDPNGIVFDISNPHHAWKGIS